MARILLLLVGAALVIVFVVRAGPGRIATELAGAGTRALWLLPLYALGTAVGAFPLAELLRQSDRPTTLGLVQGRFAASTANSLLPLFGVLGEPSRLLWLPAEAEARGIAAIAVDRLLYNGANGILLVAGAVVAATLTTLPTSIAVLAMVIGGLTLAATAVGLVLVARAGVGRRLHALLLRVLRRPNAPEDFGRAVDARLLELVRGPRGPLARALATHVVSRAILALEVPLGLFVLHAGATFAQATTLAVVPIAVSFAFSSIPSQIGVQEGAQTLVAQAIGLDPTVALSVVLLTRFRQLVFALLLPPLLASARAPERPQCERVNEP